MRKNSNPSFAKAAALQYSGQAPHVTAKGSGAVAEKIVEKAKMYDVSVFQNKALADSLLNVDIGNEIPPQLFEAVAEVFVWLIQSEEKTQLSS
ncbi:MAG: EscU/YscU/HrcU family type III secretion system export apparatus switch protein [Campylobacterota bacterium]